MKPKATTLILSSVSTEMQGEMQSLRCDFAATPAQALALLEQHRYELVVADEDLSAGALQELLCAIKRHKPPARLLLTSDRTPESICEWLRGLLRDEPRSTGPEPDSDVKTCSEFDGMLGRSEPMQRIFEVIQNVAPSDVNVLITGESGTGKELVARSIHSRSRRREHAFVPINCSAFPENLFEAELFGYEKGAFTGAGRRKIGLLEYAHQGTFFLDEVCEMPANLQAKLLRVLQDRQLRHLGDNKLIPVDVRLISASNRNLENALRENCLRQDFYFRLNVVNIHLPPLRERREDIPLLALHFLEKFLHASEKEIRGFDDEVMQVFMRYPWPGNVRELENVIERAITLAAGEIITTMDLPANMLPAGNRKPAKTGMTLIEAKQRAIDETERQYLLTMLMKYHGNITTLARESGMSRRNVHRLLKRHHIDPGPWRKRL